MVPAPPVRRRLVGGALRRYRENLGYTLDDAARILECDRSKISRIETGQRGIRGKELRELLAEYGIGDEQQKILTALAAPRGAFGWHRDYADVLPGAWQDYLILEASATRISAYEPSGSPRCCRPRPTRGNWPKPTRPWTTTHAGQGRRGGAGPAEGDPRRAQAGHPPGHRGRQRCTRRSAARKSWKGSSACWPGSAATAAR